MFMRRRERACHSYVVQHRTVHDMKNCSRILWVTTLTAATLVVYTVQAHHGPQSNLMTFNYGLISRAVQIDIFPLPTEGNF